MTKKQDLLFKTPAMLLQNYFFDPHNLETWEPEPQPLSASDMLAIVRRVPAVDAVGNDIVTDEDGLAQELLELLPTKAVPRHDILEKDPEKISTMTQLRSYWRDRVRKFKFGKHHDLLIFLARISMLMDPDKEGWVEVLSFSATQWVVANEARLLSEGKERQNLLRLLRDGKTKKKSKLTTGMLEKIISFLPRCSVDLELGCGPEHHRTNPNDPVCGFARAYRAAEVAQDERGMAIALAEAVRLMSDRKSVAWKASAELLKLREETGADELVEVLTVDVPANDAKNAWFTKDRSFKVIWHLMQDSPYVWTDRPVPVPDFRKKTNTKRFKKTQSGRWYHLWIRPDQQSAAGLHAALRVGHRTALSTRWDILTLVFDEAELSGNASPKWGALLISDALRDLPMGTKLYYYASKGQRLFEVYETYKTKYGFGDRLVNTASGLESVSEVSDVVPTIEELQSQDPGIVERVQEFGHKHYILRHSLRVHFGLPFASEWTDTKTKLPFKNKVLTVVPERDIPSVVERWLRRKGFHLGSQQLYLIIALEHLGVSKRDVKREMKRYVTQQVLGLSVPRPGRDLSLQERSLQPDPQAKCMPHDIWQVDILFMGSNESLKNPIAAEYRAGNNGYIAILYIVDECTRWTTYWLLRDSSMNSVVAGLERAILASTCPGSIKADNQFNTTMLKDWLTAWRSGVKWSMGQHKFSRPYHPQHQSLAEVTNKLWRAFWDRYQKEHNTFVWIHALPHFCYRQNHRVIADMKARPIDLLLNRQSAVPAYENRAKRLQQRQKRIDARGGRYAKKAGQAVTPDADLVVGSKVHVAIEALDSYPAQLRETPGTYDSVRTRDQWTQRAYPVVESRPDGDVVVEVPAAETFASGSRSETVTTRTITALVRPDQVRPETKDPNSSYIGPMVPTPSDVQEVGGQKSVMSHAWAMRGALVMECLRRTPDKKKKPKLGDAADAPDPEEWWLTTVTERAIYGPLFSSAIKSLRELDALLAGSLRSLSVKEAWVCPLDLGLAPFLVTHDDDRRDFGRCKAMYVRFEDGGAKIRSVNDHSPVLAVRFANRMLEYRTEPDDRVPLPLSDPGWRAPEWRESLLFPVLHDRPGRGHTKHFRDRVRFVQGEAQAAASFGAASLLRLIGMSEREVREATARQEQQDAGRNTTEIAARPRVHSVSTVSRDQLIRLQAGLALADVRVLTREELLSDISPPDAPSRVVCWISLVPGTERQRPPNPLTLRTSVVNSFARQNRSDAYAQPSRIPPAPAAASVDGGAEGSRLLRCADCVGIIPTAYITLGPHCQPGGMPQQDFPMPPAKLCRLGLHDNTKSDEGGPVTKGPGKKESTGNTVLYAVYQDPVSNEFLTDAKNTPPEKRGATPGSAPRKSQIRQDADLWDWFQHGLPKKLRRMLHKQTYHAGTSGITTSTSAQAHDCPVVRAAAILLPLEHDGAGLSRAVLVKSSRPLTHDELDGRSERGLPADVKLEAVGVATLGIAERRAASRALCLIVGDTSTFVRNTNNRGPVCFYNALRKSFTKRPLWLQEEDPPLGAPPEVYRPRLLCVGSNRRGHSLALFLLLYDFQKIPNSQVEWDLNEEYKGGSSAVRFTGCWEYAPVENEDTKIDKYGGLWAEATVHDASWEMVNRKDNFGRPTCDRNRAYRYSHAGQVYVHLKTLLAKAEWDGRRHWSHPDANSLAEAWSHTQTTVFP